ncbi:hypothetical protein PMY09_14570 [Clostridium tertium]|uniref:hypothetical protein n=1 Tax=Clostridium tertium TaxID=1559 RepID=UPI00232CB641|nr:hypothetical protein [Clostridium tertium]MDB1956038.1 hypothetical protein [Clostridium tertium]MDB1962110.1 hypothetical protein [Clostridium tertium]MDB1967183.1 hypothetical protein [Clostridium tertium]
MNKEKSNIDIINENVRKTIEKTIDSKSIDIADKVIEKLNNSNKIKIEMPYYKRVELLLYNYENLKEAVKQKEDAIAELDKYGLPERSKSIVMYSSAGGSSQADRYSELKEKYKIEKMETERDLKRIDNALDKIRDDKYFGIIQYKYLNEDEERINTDEELAQKFNKERITIIRNRKRLINKLVTILFPISISEVM